MRGIDTLAVRLNRAGENGLIIAQWPQEQPNVARVLHPALPNFAGHDIWLRDFSGAPGVFSVVFDAATSPHILPALNALEVISIGASWGGTKSLAAPAEVASLRSATSWNGPQFILQFSIGMEHVDDLKADILRFLSALTRLAEAG